MIKQARGTGYQRYKMCDTKNKYKSIDLAKAIGKVEIEKGRSKALSTYLCRFCNSWHLTSNIRVGEIKKYRI